MSDTLRQLLGLGAIGAGGLLTGKAYQRLGEIGEQARREAGDIATTGVEQTRFQPFTVTTGTGGALTTTPEGGLTVGMSPEEQAFQQQMFGGAGQFYQQAMQPTQAREQAVFERIREAQRPEEQRQRLATEERLAAQGRLGLRTAQFGGAPEQFALAKAQEEARNQAMLSAMQQAQAEMLNWQGVGSSVMEISHRSKPFIEVAAQAEQDLRDLLSVPDNYKVLFLQGGGRGQFTSVPLNIAQSTDLSLHLQSGSWSKGAVSEAAKYTRTHIVAQDTVDHTGLRVVPGQKDWSLTDEQRSQAAYLHYCPNETVDGIAIFEPPKLEGVPLVAI